MLVTGANRAKRETCGHFAPPKRGVSYLQWGVAPQTNEPILEADQASRSN